MVFVIMNYLQTGSGRTSIDRIFQNRTVMIEAGQFLYVRIGHLPVVINSAVGNFRMHGVRFRSAI